MFSPLAESPLMHKCLLAGVMGLALAGVTVTAPAIVRAADAPPKDPYPSATPQAVVAVTEKVFPAVVRLDVAAETYREGKRDVSRGIGSGVIIDEKGRV